MDNKKIEDYLLKRYPGEGKRRAVRERIAAACIDFVRSGLADSNFTKELCSDSEENFWPRVSEALLFRHLRDMGLALEERPQAAGPDFLLVKNGKRIWIEVTCPSPTDIPEDWLKAEGGSEFPHKQILLRWTSAIKDKAEKLLGKSDGSEKGYIEKGIVAPEDAYVIAINSCRLRNGHSLN